MEELFELVCSVFRDFVEGRADSAKLDCATRAYATIMDAAPDVICVHVSHDGDECDECDVEDDACDNAKDAVEDGIEDDAEHDAEGVAERADEDGAEDNILAPNFDVDIVDDPVGVAVATPVFVEVKDDDFEQAEAVPEPDDELAEPGLDESSDNVEDEGI